MGSKNATTTTAPSTQAQDAYSYIAQIAKAAAANPLQQYGGPRVAGFTGDQQQAFQNVENAQGVQNPYINAASQYAAQGATPINNVPQVGTSNVSYRGYTPTQFSSQGLAQFYDPYQQNVVDTTMANINRNNATQQSQLLGNAISSGASPFGGDRAGLAAAELARNQDMASGQTIAGLENQGYNTALGAFQNQQGLNTQAGLQNAQGALSASQGNAANRLSASGLNASNWLNSRENNAARAANAAQQYAGLGQQAQSQALTGASALLQTGQMQQKQGQQQLDNAYQNFQQQQQYPMQQAQFLISALEGIPINMGSTTTQPNGNNLTSILGGLTGLAGLFMKKGGRARRYGIGGIADAPMLGDEFEDDASPMLGHGITTPMLPPNAFKYTEPKVNWGFGNNVNSPINRIPPYINALPQISQRAVGKPIVTQLPTGILAAINNMPPWMTKYVTKSKGGGIGDYDSGGDVGIWDPKVPSGFKDDFDPQPLGNIDPVVAEGLGDTPVTSDIGKDKESSIDGHPIVDASKKTIKVHYPSDGSSVDTGIPVPPPSPTPQGGYSLKDHLNSPLLEAGLAMMASKSPNVLQGVGEGALAGLEAYKNRQMEQQRIDAANNEVVGVPGGTYHLLNKLTGKVIDTGAPVAATPTDLQRNLVSAGLKPGTPEYNQIMLDSVRGPTTAMRNAEAMGFKPGTPEYNDYLQKTGSGFGGNASPDDVNLVTQAIINGDQPPTLSGLYRNTLPVKAALEKQGFDLTKASQDWTSTNKMLSTMNGTQQTRLRQAVGTVKETLGLVDNLAEQWQAGGYPILNQANRKLALQGVYGPEANSIATQLGAEIADITAEMGTVIMGGNTPTDHSLELAAQNLSADWSYPTLKAAIALARQNIAYRENSLKLSTAGIPDSQYNQFKSVPDAPATPPGAPPAPPTAPSSHAFKEGDMATNPQTGAKVIFKGGQWIPAQ